MKISKTFKILFAIIIFLIISYFLPIIPKMETQVQNFSGCKYLVLSNLTDLFVPNFGFNSKNNIFIMENKACHPDEPRPLDTSGNFLED